MRLQFNVSDTLRMALTEYQTAALRAAFKRGKAADLSLQTILPLMLAYAIEKMPVDSLLSNK